MQDEVEINRAPFQYTFKPNVSPVRSLITQSTPDAAHKYSMNPEAQISPDRLQESSEDSLTPLLLLDVNIGGKKVARLTINEGDDINRIVNKFAKSYLLDDERKMKLTKVIEKHLFPALTAIPEERP